MGKTMSQIFLETFVKKSLTELRQNPRRGIRNLVDMALTCSNGRFQKDFFTTAQTMLQNNHSAYYDLVRKTLRYAENNRLYTFGMNLGYNACTEGAKKIRENEAEMNCNIPWTILLQTPSEISETCCRRYDTLLSEGEKLGIHSWMIFTRGFSGALYTIVKNHPDSVFFIFSDKEDFSDDYFNLLEQFYHVMPVIRYDDDLAGLCTELQAKKLLYSLWYPYDEGNAKDITDKTFFHRTKKLCPFFSVFVPLRNCPQETRSYVYQEIQSVRSRQIYPTIAWDLQGDNDMIDSIISDDSCSVCFDYEGNLHCLNDTICQSSFNLFQSSLKDILTNCFSKAAA